MKEKVSKQYGQHYLITKKETYFYIKCITQRHIFVYKIYTIWPLRPLQLMRQSFGTGLIFVKALQCLKDTVLNESLSILKNCANLYII